MRIVANGRFRLAKVTGVQRYANELLKRVRIVDEVLTPPVWARESKGHLWEQVLLPIKCHGRLLWSPCNTGPLAVENQALTLHDCSVIDSPEGFSPAFLSWYRFLLPRLVKRVRAVFTVSEFSRSRISNAFGIADSKIQVIPNGISPCFLSIDKSAIEEAKVFFHIDSPYLLCLGSIEPRKNIERLLGAYEKIRSRIGNIPLFIAGGSESVFKRTGIEKIPLGVKFLGYVEDRWLPGLYAGAQLFIYPSVYEGFGLPPLEAAASGTPAICSRIPAHLEIAGDLACTFDPLDVESLAVAIQTALEDERWRLEARKKGIERARLLTWEAAAEKLSVQLKGLG